MTPVDALVLAERPERRVLDLGDGTRLLPGLVHSHYPHAELCCSTARL